MDSTSIISVLPIGLVFQDKENLYDHPSELQNNYLDGYRFVS